MAGIYNAVAVLGTDLSGPQRSLLLERECFDIVLGLDNDIAGIDATNKIKKSCSAYFQIYQYQLPKGKDIGDLSVEELQNLDIIKV
jgi:DNA primase